MTAVTLGVDLSHYQSEPNWPLLARSCGFVVLKATEGTGYADPTWSARRRAAHAAGIPAVGAYHFAQLGNAQAEAAAFLTAVGPLAATEFTALDLEVAVAGVDVVAWSAAWLDAVHARTGRWPLIYINGSELAGLNWAPVAARGVRLWLAKYDHTTSPVGSGAFPVLELKQFTDAGIVPGVAGTVDEDVLYGTPLDLLGDPAMSATGPASWDAADWAAFSAQTGVAVWGFKTSGGSTQAQDRVTGIDAVQLPALAKAVAGLAAQLAAVQTAVGALPQQTAAALPAMACQGNPQAVLTALSVKLAAPTPATA